MKVMRSYTTGLSLSHYPKEERKEVRKKLQQILWELSDENLKICQKHNETAIEYLTSKGFVDQPILAPLPVEKGRRGKFGVNALMNQCGDARNHVHSGFHLLNNSAKGFIDRISKFQQILEWLRENPEELVKWVFWQRSTYAISTFQQKWGLSFHYLDPLMRGVHHKFFTDILPANLAPLSHEQVIQSLKNKIAELQNQDELTEGSQSFLNSLQDLEQILVQFADQFEFSKIPSGWKQLKEWVNRLQLPTYGLERWASVFRTLFARCYLPVYERMKETREIPAIETAPIRALFKIPFASNPVQTQKLLPYQMVSGPKYVIQRENNQKNLELLRKQGYFPLRLKFLGESWSTALEVRVIPSRKIKDLLHQDIKLKCLSVLPPREGSRDVDIQLILEGEPEAFVATNHLQASVNQQVRKQLGVDLNRMGEYALVSSLNLKIPAELQLIEQRWRKVDQQIKKQQKLLASPRRKKKLRRYQADLRLLYRRRANLRQTYHQKLGNWLGQQLVGCGAEVLIMEDLKVHTYGTRKALARAIESMADEKQLYLREVLAVQLYTQKNCKLVTLPAFNSSRLHVGCGGMLDRSKEHHDLAPCKKCKRLVNTHHNATLFLEAKYLKVDYKKYPGDLSTVQVIS